MDAEIAITRCSKTIYSKDQWGHFYPHQCKRKAWKNGFCKVHHPESVKARRIKHDNSPLVVLRGDLDEARERIMELEGENVELKEKINVLEEQVYNLSYNINHSSIKNG